MKFKVLTAVNFSFSMMSKVPSGNINSNVVTSQSWQNKETYTEEQYM